MRCQECGTENPDDGAYCLKCGNWLSRPASDDGRFGPVAEKSNRNAVLLTVVVTVAVVVMVALIAYVQSLTPARANLTMTNWEHASTSSAGGVIFLVDVSNIGTSTGSAAIRCSVTYGNGDHYFGWQNVTLGPGEVNRFVVTVVISLSHMIDTSGVYECRLIAPIE